MINRVDCEKFVDRLADLLERDLDETTRAALESHALSCGDCGPLLADVRKLRIDASSLPVLAPKRDLWEGIAARIDAPVIPLRSDVAPSERSRRWPSWASMAAAAILLVALTSTSTYYLTIRNGGGVQPAKVASATLDPTRAPKVAADASAPAVATAPGNERSTSDREPSPPTRLVSTNAKTRPSAEQVYSREIARLHTIVERRRTQLDPVTISVIERNLKVIDDAIAQCRLALAKDPGSRFLMESLNNALENKVELLRTATMLPARS